MSFFRNSWLKRLFYLLLGLSGLYLLTGFLLIPALATFLAPRLAKDHLEGRLETGWIGLNPFTFTVSLPEVSWTGTDGEALAGFDRLRINADPLGSLFHREWRIAGISLESAFVEVTVNEDGSLNLLNALAARPDAPETSDEKAGSTLPPAWLGLLEVTDLTVSLTDLRPEQAFQKEIASIHFHLADLRTQPEHESPYQFSALTGANESVALKGNLQLHPLLVTGDLTAADILLSEYTFYLSNAGPLNLKSGHLALELPFSAGLREGTVHAALADGRIELAELKAALEGSSPLSLALGDLLLEGINVDVSLDPEDGFSAEAGARLELNRFEATTPEMDNPLATFEALTAEDIKVGLDPLSLTASGIDWTRPGLVIERDASGSITLLNLLQAPDADPVESLELEPGENDGEPASLPSIHIDRFAVNDGRIRFRDASVDPVAEFGLEPVDFLLEPVSLDPETVSSAVFKANFEESASINLESSLYLADPFFNTLAEMRIDKIPLSVSTPYALQFIGRPVSAGTFSGDFTYGLTESALTASNVLAVDSIAFGDPAEGYEGKTYPVDLAIALLQNNRNEIAIDIPVSGSLDDPTFHPAGVIRSVLTGLLTKAVTSPFNLVAGMTGSVVSGVAAIAQSESTNTDYSRLTFQNGRFSLEKEAEPVLEAISEMLNSRPRIDLGLSGSVDTEADRRALEEARFRERLEAFEGAEESEKIRDAYIREILKRDPDAARPGLEAPLETAETAPEPEPEPEEEPAEDAPGTTELIAQASLPEPEPTPMEEAGPDSGKSEPGMVVTRRGLRKFSRPATFVAEPTPATEEQPGDKGAPATPAEAVLKVAQSSGMEEAGADPVADAAEQVSLTPGPETEPEPEPGPEVPDPLPDLPSREAMAEALENHWFEDPPDLDQLGRQRAEVVRDYFLTTGEIHPDRIELSETVLRDGPLVEFTLKPE